MSCDTQPFTPLPPHNSLQPPQPQPHPNEPACVILTLLDIKNCMYLLRLIIMDNLIHNRRIFARYVKSKDNEMVDLLSRLQFKHFRKLAEAKPMDAVSTQVSRLVWPLSSIWFKS